MKATGQEKINFGNIISFKLNGAIYIAKTQEPSGFFISERFLDGSSFCFASGLIGRSQIKITVKNFICIGSTFNANIL